MGACFSTESTASTATAPAQRSTSIPNSISAPATASGERPPQLQSVHSELLPKSTSASMSHEPRLKRSANISLLSATASSVLDFIAKRSRFTFRSGTSSSATAASSSMFHISPGGPHSEHGSYSLEEALLPLFLRYVNFEEDGSVDINDANFAMGLEGVVRFLEDLNLTPDDFRVLLFAWHCQASQQCRFLWCEFVRGCMSLEASTLPGLLDSLTRRQSEVRQDEAEFMALYKWAFQYCLDGEHQRCLKKENALAMWKVLFDSPSYQALPLLPSPSLHGRIGRSSEEQEARSIALMVRAWLDFVQEQVNVRLISQDTWDMFLKFLQIVGRDSTQYNDADAWPTLMDHFMESQMANQLRDTAHHPPHHHHLHQNDPNPHH